MRRQGKPSKSFMNSIFRNLGASRKDVLVGPGVGLDNAVVSTTMGDVLILTADPVSIIPTIELEASAWMSVHLIASDFATSGVSPQYASFTFNFPPSLGEKEARRYLSAVGRECGRLGVSIVAGHTGSYPGGGYTVIGGGTMLGFAPRGRYIDPTMARPGDDVLMTKGVAIEATATLANSFPRFLEERLGRSAVETAKRMTRDCSTVAESLAASRVGLGDDGVTSMHDATEGGVLGGLAEMAEASRSMFVIEETRIPVSRITGGVCGAFGMDPLVSLSEGTLLLTSKITRTGEVAAAIERTGARAFVIGKVEKGSGLWLAGKRRKRVSPRNDPFWRAYGKATRMGLS